MNYHETKESAVSDFIDSVYLQPDASIRFCLDSDLVPKPDLLYNLFISPIKCKEK